MSNEMKDIVPDEDIMARSMRVLGWPEVTAALAERAASVPGRTQCSSPVLYETAAAAETALSETAEMVDLFNRGAPLAAAPVSDVIALVEKARAGGILDPLDLAAVSDTIEHAGAASAFFAGHREAERLSEWAARISDQRDLLRKLVRSVDRDGGILDSAGPALSSLRSRHRTLKERIHKRLSEIVAKNPDTVLQDSFYTQRGQRYVVPVKASEQAKFEGIVHDASSSGQTVFVEPAELVEPNNRIKLIEAEIEAEVIRILRELSLLVAGEADRIITAQQVLAHLDVVRARARLARDLAAGRPRLNEQGRINLKNARHPLLLLRGLEVVPNDIELGADFSVLLVSGPNTGGKTVGLTTLGLLAMMARAGMFIPADDGSEMAVLSEVYAVLGDEQDIARDLSSFSAHLYDIIRILEGAGPRSLVLLDELMSSTDPEEGSALAAVVLSALRERGALVAVTTHLPALKSFAHERDGFANAGYTFDPRTLAPTYRLLAGVPGRSLGIEVARRLGLPAELIEEAGARMDQSSLHMESLISDLVAKTADLDGEMDGLLSARHHLEEMTTEYRGLRDRAREHELEIKHSVRAAVREAVARVEAEIESIAAPIRSRKQATRENVIAVRKNIKQVKEKIEKQYGSDAAEGGEPDWTRLGPGDKVQVLPLGIEAEIISSPGGDVAPGSEVLVKIGKMKVRVAAQKIRALPARREAEDVLHPRPKKKKKPTKEQRVTIEAADRVAGPVMPQSSGNTLDLRGKRVHEAEAMVEAFLDEACRGHRLNVFIIHGHGTGALKVLVRELLALSPYVESFRPGEKGEGGDGVTMAVLKELG